MLQRSYLNFIQTSLKMLEVLDLARVILQDYEYG